MSLNTERAALEQALRDDPGNATLHYLLGAELAQTGDYAQAVSELGQAVGLDSSLHTARFQLGLLHLTLGHPERAVDTWRPLDSQPDLSLRHFGRGLEALVRDDFSTCVQELEAGIAVNHANPPLNHDMQVMIAKVREHLGRGDGTQAQPEPVRTDFSLYSR